MKKLKRLFANKNIIRNLHSKKMFGFAVAGAGIAALGAQAQAQVLIHDDFTSGSQYGGTWANVSPTPGKSPSGTDLPGGTWQYEGDGNSGYGGTVETTTTNNSYKIGGATGVSHFASSHNGSSAAISLMSSGGYTEPTTLIYSATVSPSAGGSGTGPGSTAPEAFMGYFNTISSSNYSGPGRNAFVGLALDSSGIVSFDVNNTLTATSINAGAGAFDANTFTTLSFQLAFDTSTDVAVFSDIVLNGVSYSDTLTTGPLSPNTINYAGFSSNNIADRSAISSFTITGVVAAPEPSTYALLAGGALALGAYQYRRRQQSGI